MSVLARCPHPDVDYLVMLNSVFVRCRACGARGRVMFMGEYSNRFNSETVRVVLDGLVKGLSYTPDKGAEK